MKFVRKVYSILAIQLSLTCVLIFMVQSNESMRVFCQKAIWL